MGSYRGEPLYHASLSAAEYLRLLHAKGFTVLKHVAEDLDCGFHTVWLWRRWKSEAGLASTAMRHASSLGRFV
jgi:hypothetical protein